MVKENPVLMCDVQVLPEDDDQSEQVSEFSSQEVDASMRRCGE